MSRFRRKHALSPDRRASAAGCWLSTGFCHLSGLACRRFQAVHVSSLGTSTMSAGIASDPDRQNDPGSKFSRHLHPVSLATDRGTRWYLDASRMHGQQSVELPRVEQLA